MQHKELPARKPIPTFATDLCSGIISGKIYALAFHPVDRAVYFSVVHKRPFFITSNFSSPYHGLLQSMFKHAFIGSGYYVAQAQLRSHLVPFLREATSLSESGLNAVTGCAAGLLQGVITNTPSYVRAHTWGNAAYSFSASVKMIYQIAGHRAFSTGLGANALRDAIYGSTYEVCRHFLREQAKAMQLGSAIEQIYLNFSSDAAAAALATMLVSPLSYIRYMKYAAPLNAPIPSMAQISTDLWKRSRQESEGIRGRFGFFQTQFCLGASTLRAAGGMAFGQIVFEQVREKLTDLTP